MKTVCKLLFLLVCYFSCSVISDISEDVRLNFTQLAEKYGRKCEVFDVVTEDNYILKLFHIKGDETKPVLLGHGILITADGFIMRGKSSLAITLAAKGYDVWALNFRGSKYGRRHVTLNPEMDKAFWNFSFHEMGMYDLPAHIDFVLNKTKQSQLIYIGHSQGTQIGFVLESLKSEYNAKIKVHIALSPIAFLHNIPLNFIVPVLWPVLNLVLLANGEEEVVKKNWPLTRSFRRLCLNTNGYEKCGLRIIFEVMGPDPPEMEPEFFPVFIGHYLSPSSRKNIDHIAQVLMRKKFSQYDYGLRNLEVYGTLEPLDYPLNNITSPVFLIVGENDRLSTIADVKILESRLPNVHYYQIERKGMNHADFICGKNMENYLFPLLFEILQHYTRAV